MDRGCCEGLQRILTPSVAPTVAPKNLTALRYASQPNAPRKKCHSIWRNFVDVRSIGDDCVQSWPQL